MGETAGKVIQMSDHVNARRRRQRHGPPEEAALTIRVHDPKLAELILALAGSIEVPDAVAGESLAMQSEAAVEGAIAQAVGLLAMHLGQLGANRKGPYYARCNVDEAERGRPDKVLSSFLGPKLVLGDLPEGVPAMPPAVALPQ